MIDRTTDTAKSEELKLLDTARRNVRTFISGATFKCRADQEAALACVDVLESHIQDQSNLIAILRDVVAIDAHPASSPPQNDAGGEVVALRSALRNLLDACYQADGAENLPEEIDGSLLDAASEALELQYPIIWTDEQVAMLEKRQADSSLHPYTCGGDRSDRAHRWHADESGEEAGLLYPTVRGWKCPACDYRQFWSHETGGPLSELQALGQEFEAGEKECPLSPDGKHQVDTSMESGFNHCFHCEKPMPGWRPPSSPSGEG